MQRCSTVSSSYIFIYTKNDNTSNILPNLHEASKLLSIALEASTKMSKLYCKYSTHVKCGAITIAHNETQKI